MITNKTLLKRLTFIVIACGAIALNAVIPEPHYSTNTHMHTISQNHTITNIMLR